MAEVSNVVLVHGAWADGSSRAKLIPLLEEAGLNAVAVQNPLTSLADDVAATKRAIARLDGQVVLVGHSPLAASGSIPRGTQTAKPSTRPCGNRPRCHGVHANAVA